MSYELIELAYCGDYATITMNNPRRRNALSLKHMLELTDAFSSVGESGVRGVILAANGPVFSAGHDFADMVGQDLVTMREVLHVCTTLMDTIQEIPQPVLARVHGLATAAGCQLVATCDLAVASTEAAFATPGGKGGWFCTTPMVAVSRAIGRKRALEMLLTAWSRKASANRPTMPRSIFLNRKPTTMPRRSWPLPPSYPTPRKACKPSSRSENQISDA